MLAQTDAAALSGGMDNTCSPTDLAVRFGHFFGELRQRLTGRFGCDRAALPLLMLVNAQLGRKLRRLVALLAAFRAGTLPPPRPSHPPAARAQPDAAASAAAAPGSACVPPAASVPPAAPVPPSASVRVPRRRAWLLNIGMRDAALFSALLHIMMADPEMQAFLAACPQAARMLRPVWRMATFDPLPAPLRPPCVPARPPARAPRPRPHRKAARRPRPAPAYRIGTAPGGGWRRPMPA